MEKRAPVQWLVGLRIRSEFLRTHNSDRHEIPCNIPRSRRVTAKHISGGFGVSGV